MADRNLSDLDPVLQPIAQDCLDTYKSTYPERRTAAIIVTWRSDADQQAAYDAGLSRCKSGEGKHNVTIDGKPASRAFDFAVFTDDGHYIANGEHPYYADFAAIGKALGLNWGGDWTEGFRDWDHMELSG
jgi:hypothetical protein